jgi:hypothetical protein
MDKRELLTSLQSAAKQVLIATAVAVVAKELRKTDFGGQQVVLFTARK